MSVQNTRISKRVHFNRGIGKKDFFGEIAFELGLEG